MEGSTVQRCIFISYVSNVQPEGGGGAVPRQSTPFLKYYSLKLVSHVVQKRHDDTQETQKQSKGLFTWR